MLSRAYYELTIWPAPSWLDSSVGRALHRHRRGHGFESRSSLNFFQAFFSQLLKLRSNCEDLFSIWWFYFVWLRNWNRSWRPSAFTSLLLLTTNDNRAWQCPFDGRKEQVKFSGRNYSASSFFGSTVPSLDPSLDPLFLSIYVRVISKR